MTALVKAKGKQSGWVRRGKREFLYSTVLRNWEDAVKAGKPDETDKYAAQHARLFSYVNYGG